MKQWDILADGIVDRVNCGLLVVDREFTIIRANKWLLEQARVEHADIVGKLIFDAFKLSDSGSLFRAMEQALNDGFSSNLSNLIDPHLLPLYKLGQNDRKLIQQQCYVLPVEADNERYVVLQINDVSDAVSLQQKVTGISDSLEKFSRAVELSPNSVILTDRDGTIEYVNKRFCNISGYSALEAIGQSYFVLFDNEQSHDFAQQVKASLTAGTSWSGEKLNRKKNGDLYWSKEHLSPIIDGNGKASHLVVMQEDVTEAHNKEKEISYQSSHDMLTGLLNRREFERILSRLVELTRDSEHQHVLCFLDLDQFKIINDTCGHVVGDELLRQISTRILSNLASDDTFARIGGDEFAIVLHSHTLDEAKAATQQLVKLVEDFRFRWEQHVFTIGVSIGITAINRDTVSSVDVIKQADSACYAAKDTGRNRVHVYHNDDKMMVQRQGDTYWVTQINEALEYDRFVLYAQPIVPILTDDKLSYEILVRIKKADGGLIAPGVFLPPAERYNLSHRIDEWVIDSTLAWLNLHAGEIAHIDHISINLSGQTLSNEILLTHIKNALDECLIEPSKLSFEITETAAIANLGHAQYFINTLREYGCKFALDDFGSGLSSFAYLKNLHVDYLKIDGMFVKDILVDSIDEAMVRSINDVGHVIGMQTIAEFVENDEIKQRLTEIGVDYGQGYGLGKPAPIDEILVLSVQTA